MLREMSMKKDLLNSFQLENTSQMLMSKNEKQSRKLESQNPSLKSNQNSSSLNDRNQEKGVGEIKPDLLHSYKTFSNTISIQNSQQNSDNEFEKESLHSNGSLKMNNLPPKVNVNVSYNRRYSLPVFALDKVKNYLSPKTSLSNTQFFYNSSVVSRRKKSIIELFNSIGTNLGLVSPKKNSGNGVMISALHGSSGSIDIDRMRHHLGILEMNLATKNASAVPITSIDEIYYRPHRSFARDILCCICFKKHDEYDNLIESHSCARIFTALVLVTILCMLIGYIIKAAGEKK